jgi:hypothetical protein
MRRLIGVLKEHEAGADVLPQPTQMRQRSHLAGIEQGAAALI